MNNKSPSKFGVQLKLCRSICSVTQENLADYIDKDPSLISYYETGKGLPDEARLQQFAKYFRGRGVPQEEIQRLFEFAGFNALSSTNVLSAQIDRLIKDAQEYYPYMSIVEDELSLYVTRWQLYIDAYRDLKRSAWDDALETFMELKEALDEYDISREILQLRILHGVGNAHRISGEVSKGLREISEAIRIAENSKSDHYSMLAKLRLDRGNFYRRQSEWISAGKDYEESRRIYKKIVRSTAENQQKNIAIVDRKIAGSLLFQGKANEAIKYCERSLETFEDLGDIEEKAKSLQHLAWARAMVGLWDEALKTHKDVITLLQSNSSPPVIMAKSYRYLADMYRMCGLFFKAEKAYVLALESLKEHLRFQGEMIDDYLIYGLILLGQGAVLSAMPSKQDEAKTILDKSLAIQIKIGAKHHEAITRSELGKLSINRMKYEEAEKQIKKAKDIFEKLNNSYYQAAQLINLCNLELKRGAFPKARALARNAIDFCNDHSFDIHKIRAKVLLACIEKQDADSEIPLELAADLIEESRKINDFFLLEILNRLGDRHTILDEEGTIQDEIVDSARIAKENWGISVDDKDLIGKSKERFTKVLNDVLANSSQHLQQIDFSNAYGLIIGVANYRYLYNLKKTTADARDLYGLLLDNGYSESNITFLSDEEATKSRISDELDQITRNASADDLIILFFSGHGLQNIGGFDQGEYICPVETDPDRLSSTAISNEDLTNAIRAFPSKRVVVFLDACHSGGVGQPKDDNLKIKAGLSESTYQQLAVGEGRVVIASCLPNEISWEIGEMQNGLFSHYLLEGLRGEAKKENRYVGILDLFDYLSKQVPKIKQQQHPLLKGELVSNFPIAR